MSRFRFFKSIFPKLIIIILFFGILINISIWAFFRFSTEGAPRRFIPVYILKMNEYIIKDIGVPPDTVKARNLAEDLNLNIRFQSHDMNWTTSEHVPKIEELATDEEFKEKFPSTESFRMEYEERPIYVFKKPLGVYIFSTLSSQDFFNPERAIVILVILVSIIFIPLYFLLRWLFNPLKRLTYAVEQIGEGNYDVDVKVKRGDEMGELADSITEMSSKIKHSVRSKEQLLLDVSHELRSPLTRIKLGLEVDSSKEKINEDVIEMEKMISGLLENYRVESDYDTLKFERIDIVDLIEDVISEYVSNERLLFKKPDKEKVFINVDPEKVRMVLRNIIENALKYSSDKIDIWLSERNESVMINIKDKGIGISEEDLKYIFEPFYRADRSRSRKTGGFGLGLSISKKIMDNHHGSIVINSKPNAGTQVILTFKKY
jgi:signal transduction histidine kinase